MTGLIIFVEGQGQSVVCEVEEGAIKEIKDKVVKTSSNVKGFDTVEGLTDMLKETRDLLMLQEIYESMPASVRTAFLDRLGYGGNC